MPDTPPEETDESQEFMETGFIHLAEGMDADGEPAYKFQQQDITDTAAIGLLTTALDYIRDRRLRLLRSTDPTDWIDDG